MSSINIDLLDYFVTIMNKKFEVAENQSRFLFERWNIQSLGHKSKIDKFVSRDDVKSVFFIKPDLNISKSYTEDDLSKIGITLKVVDVAKHIFKDEKYGFTWEEVFHGMSDCWIGEFRIKDPSPIDKHLCRISNECFKQ